MAEKAFWGKTYIGDKPIFKAVMFAISMIKQYGDIDGSVEKASLYYGVNETRVAFFVNEHFEMIPDEIMASYTPERLADERKRWRKLTHNNLRTTKFEDVAEALTTLYKKAKYNNSDRK